MNRSTRPPLSSELARALREPSQADKQRIRDRLERSFARGEASQTVLRVDASMAERALGVPLGASNAALLKLLVPALLLGAGLGALGVRLLYEPKLQPNTVAPVQPMSMEPLEAADGDMAQVGAGGFAAPELARADEPGAADGLDEHTVKHERASTHPGGHGTRPHRAADIAPSPAAASEPERSTFAQATASEFPTHHLAEELRLMRAASAALSANDIPHTLNLLAEHAERFPDGALRDERRALRVISLCTQGRSHFALVERDEFLHSSPHSPLTARVRDACETTR